MFDFSIVTNWIHQTLTSLMPEGLAIFLECVVIGVCIILMYAVLAIILRRAEDAHQRNLHSESCRPLPLQPGTVHGDHSFISDICLPPY